MALDFEKLRIDILNSFLTDVSNSLSEEDYLTVSSMAESRANSLAQAIFDFVKSSNVVVNEGIESEQNIESLKYLTITKGNGYIE